MGNTLSSKVYHPIPGSIHLEHSEIRQNSKNLFNTILKDSKAADLSKDPWYPQYSQMLTKKESRLMRVRYYLPGLGTALGIFGIYCGLEYFGLFDDGGWSAWKHEKH